MQRATMQIVDGANGNDVSLALGPAALQRQMLPVYTRGQEYWPVLKHLSIIAM